jgi:hypothetical protein
MWSKKHYECYQDSCGCDDIYQICDPSGNVIKSIIFWDDDFKWVVRAKANAERICRWLNRRPSLRNVIGRIRWALNPTRNHPRPDVYQLVRNSGRIAFIYDYSHVLSERIHLTGEQAREVLNQLDDDHLIEGMIRQRMGQLADEIYPNKGE